MYRAVAARLGTSFGSRLGPVVERSNRLTGQARLLHSRMHLQLNQLQVVQYIGRQEVLRRGICSTTPLMKGRNDGASSQTPKRRKPSKKQRKRAKPPLRQHGEPFAKQKAKKEEEKLLEEQAKLWQTMSKEERDLIHKGVDEVVEGPIAQQELGTSRQLREKDADRMMRSLAIEPDPNTVRFQNPPMWSSNGWSPLEEIEVTDEMIPQLEASAETAAQRAEPKGGWFDKVEVKEAPQTDNTLGAERTSIGTAPKFHKLIRVLCAQGRFSEAMRRVWPEMKKRGLVNRNGPYIALMSGAARNRDAVAAREIWGELQKSGFEKDHHCWNVYMTALARAGCIDEAVAVGNDMREAGHPWTVMEYTTLMAACNAKEDYKRTERFWKEMIMFDIEPDVMSYTAMMQAYGKMFAYEAALRLFEQMEQVAAIRPTLGTFEVLLRAAATAPHHIKVYGECVDDIVQRIIGMRLKPTEDTYRALIYAYGKSRDSDRVLQCIQEVHELRSVDVDSIGDGVGKLMPSTYNAILRALADCSEVGLRRGKEPRWGCLLSHGQAEKSDITPVRIPLEDVRHLDLLKQASMEWDEDGEAELRKGQTRKKFKGVSTKEEFIDDPDYADTIQREHARIFEKARKAERQREVEENALMGIDLEELERLEKSRRPRILPHINTPTLATDPNPPEWLSVRADAPWVPEGTSLPPDFFFGKPEPLDLKAKHRKTTPQEDVLQIAASDSQQDSPVSIPEMVQNMSPQTVEEPERQVQVQSQPSHVSKMSKEERSGMSMRQLRSQALARVGFAPKVTQAKTEDLDPISVRIPEGKSMPGPNAALGEDGVSEDGDDDNDKRDEDATVDHHDNDEDVAKPISSKQLAALGFDIDTTQNIRLAGTKERIDGEISDAEWEALGLEDGTEGASYESFAAPSAKDEDREDGGSDDTREAEVRKYARDEPEPELREASSVVADSVREDGTGFEKSSSTDSKQSWRQRRSGILDVLDVLDGKSDFVPENPGPIHDEHPSGLPLPSDMDRVLAEAGVNTQEGTDVRRSRDGHGDKRLTRRERRRQRLLEEQRLRQQQLDADEDEEGTSSDDRRGSQGKHKMNPEERETLPVMEQTYLNDEGQWDEERLMMALQEGEEDSDRSQRAAKLLEETKARLQLGPGKRNNVMDDTGGELETVPHDVEYVEDSKPAEDELAEYVPIMHMETAERHHILKDVARAISSDAIDAAVRRDERELGQGRRGRRVKELLSAHLSVLCRMRKSDMALEFIEKVYPMEGGRLGYWDVVNVVHMFVSKGRDSVWDAVAFEERSREEFGLPPNKKALGLIVDAWARYKDMDNLHAALDRMQELNVKPTQGDVRYVRLLEEKFGFSHALVPADPDINLKRLKKVARWHKPSRSIRYALSRVKKAVSIGHRR